MGKDAYNISASATVLHEAQKAVRANPSSAEDALSADRTAKHFCQYVNNHACMELEATQAAALVLGIDSYGGSDDLDYHSAWDTIKVAAYAVGGKLNKLKEEPGMADCDAPLEDESDPCRAICSNGRPCRNQVHRNAGTDGHCPFTCELHKHLRVEELQEGGADELADSDGEVVVSDSDGEDDDLLARGNVDAEAAAGVADDTGPRAATRRAATRGPQRDLLAFFRVDGGTKDGSCNVYTLSDGTPVNVCPAFCYAYRDARLHVFNPIEFRRRWVAPSREPALVTATLLRLARSPPLRLFGMPSPTQLQARENERGAAGAVRAALGCGELHLDVLAPEWPWQGP